MHVFDPTILREYDIRGTVGENLGPEDALALGRAYGTLIGGDGGRRVAVGYDGRHSSPELEAALVEGITSTGLDVLRVGLGPTPMLYFAVFELDLDGGVQITGSHNPPDFNGFKMMRGKASLHGEDIQTLGRIAAAGDWDSGDGSAAREDMLDRYVARLTRDFGDLRLSAAWDAGNGAAGEAVKRVTEALSNKQTLLYCDIDGDFPNHHPDPTVEENLADLKEAVIEGGLDAGLGFDGDGDRIGAIDGSGHVVWGDQILLLLARDVLKEVPGATVIADVKSSQSLFDEIERLGGNPVMWKTGHSLIKTRMAELEAPLAGEMSGHIFFKHRFYGFDDAIYAGLRLLAAVQDSGQSLEELRQALPSVVNTPELRFSCPEERKFAAVDEVRERMLAEDREAVTIDGVRVKTHDGWWLLRASNTQPVLVARAEAPDEERLNLIKEELVEILEGVGLTPPEGI